jgi:PE family
VSFVLTAPELVTAAAGNLAGIGSTLGEATAAAAGPTTGVATAAADEVSTAISQLFATYGEEFQAVSAQAAAFHNEFVSLLNGGAAAYLSADIASAQRGLPSAAPAATAPGGAYQQLFATTGANLQSLVSAWQADPFPVLNKVVANQMVYWREIATAVSYVIQNFPTVLANLPAAIQAGIQGLLAFNAASFIQQGIATQLGFLQTFAVSSVGAITGLAAGLPDFLRGSVVALQALVAGDYYGAVQDFAQALTNLFITGYTVTNLTAGVTGIFPNFTITLGANAEPVGPLEDILTIAAIPGQEAQYFTNLMPQGTIPQKMSQNLTNVLVTATNSTVTGQASIPLLSPASVQYSAFFGLPLAVAYAGGGAAVSGLTGLAATGTAFQQALLAGDGVGALGVLIDAPAIVTDGFLNGEVIVDAPVLVPTGLPAPFFPTTVSIVTHVPFDGILVPPHPITATIDLPGYPAPGFPVTEVISGTPFSGIVPMLVNYVPQQLAAAIVPAT